MPPFRFRLATLLKLRESLRDERRGQLAEAYAADRKLKERRESVERELNHIHATASVQSVGTVHVERLLDLSRFDALLRGEIGIIRGHEAQLAVEIEKRRQALVAADRDVRMLEKLREVKQAEHRTAEATALMKQLDEVAGRQSGREEIW